MAEGGIVHPQVVADLADHHLSGVDAHPHRKVEPLLEAQLVRVAAKILLQGERGIASALRVVFECDRGTK